MMEATNTSKSISTAVPGRFRPRYSWYVAIVFAGFFALSFMDRQIIGVLVEPMKSGLMLTDVQLGLIGGLSFAIFFVSFGLPIGRLSDRYNRKRIIIAGVLIWSGATVLCSFATGFWELLVLRMGDDPRNGSGPDDGAVV